MKRDEQVDQTLNVRAPHPIPSWEREAKLLLRAAMARQEANFKVLSRNLEKLDVYETAAQLNRKINRGKFSAGFFLACLTALDMREIAVPAARSIQDKSGDEPATMA